MYLVSQRNSLLRRPALFLARLPGAGPIISCLIMAATTTILGPTCLAAQAEQSRQEFRGPVITFAASAERVIPNDFGQATLVLELTGKQAAALTLEAERRIAEALARAAQHPAVTLRNATATITPCYQEGRPRYGRRCNFYLRRELTLESDNLTELSVLVADLQDTLLLDHIWFEPGKESRRRAEDEVTAAALADTTRQAARIAAPFNRPYRILRLEINKELDGSPRSFEMYEKLSGSQAKTAPLSTPSTLTIPPGQSTIRIGVQAEIQLIEQTGTNQEATPSL